MNGYDYGTPDMNTYNGGGVQSGNRQGMGMNSPQGYTANKSDAGSAITGIGGGLLSTIGGFATANPYLVIGGAIQLFGSVFGSLFAPEPELTPEQKHFERLTTHYRNLGKKTNLANGILKMYAPKAKPMKIPNTWAEDTGDTGGMY